MKDRPLFSVKNILLSKGGPEEIFRRSIIHAQEFILAHSIPELLQSVFAQKKNREVVKVAVHDFMHVGFVSPHRGLPHMEDIAGETGFGSVFSTVTSSVVAHELGYLESCPDIPTSIFTAKMAQRDSAGSYVEVFLPDASPVLLEKWIKEETGTHIGLISKWNAKDDDSPGSVQTAFLDEGFQIPPFMQGKPIHSPGKAASVIYYEKPWPNGKLRVEIFSPLR